MKRQPILPDYSKYNLFITLEGLDATYKETNAKAIASYLKEDFKKYIDSVDLQIKIVSFPRYKSEASYFVKRHLANKFVDHPKVDINPESMDYLKFVSNLFLLDMYDWYESMRVNKAFSKPTIIIFDRYWYSMLYYLTKDIQGTIDKVHLKEPEEFIKKCQKIVFNMAHVYYKLPVTDILINLHNNNIDDINKKLNIRGNKKDGYESDDCYLGFVRNTFNNTDFTPYVNSKYSNITNINVEGKDREAIKEEIVTALKPSLRRFKLILSARAKRK